MMTTAYDLALRPLSGAVGAEVHGVELRDLDDEMMVAVTAALADYHVLVFPGQDLSDAEQVAVAGRFGEVTPASAVVPGLPGAPEIALLDTDRGYGGDDEIWHTDLTYVATPPSITVLRPVAVPSVGHDTVFVSTEVAYERLSPALRELAQSLVSIHDGGATMRAALARAGQMRWAGTTSTTIDPVEHPVVIAEPISGRPALSVNPMFTVGLKGLARHESRAILELLMAHIGRPEHGFRHRWEPGSVVIRKNVSIWHRLVEDERSVRWAVHRVSARPCALAAARPPASDERQLDA